MKLSKRLAAVAAAAVVGPTVLMSTPAMADEAQPAVSVPDAEPKGDTAAPATPETAATTPEAPATAATPVTPVTPVTPAAPAAPEAKQPEAPTAPKPADVQDEVTAEDEAPDILMGPEVTVRGIPKKGFKKDGSWTELTVEVDNSGHITVPDYTPSLNLMQWDGALKTSQVKVERRVGGAWQAVQAKTSESMGPGFKYELGINSPLASGADYTVDVRIAFTPDAPVVAFDMYADGVSVDGKKVRHSPATWYGSRIEGAEGGNEGPEVIEGPALTLDGVPGIVAVGGDWTELTVHVDNTGKKAQAQFGLGLALSRPDFVPMLAKQFELEVYSKDINGRAGWHAAESGSDSDGLFYGFGLATGPVKAGQSFDVKVRIRFKADFPLGELTLRAWGGGQLDEEALAYVESRSKARLITVVAADQNHDNTGNQPNPNGGATPINTGGGTHTGTTTAPAPTGGELAATGADPATSWALGGAGVAVAMGAALVAGTGRRRRTTA